MIRKLTIKDTGEYLLHLNRVYDQKGLMSAEDEEWIEHQRTTHVTIEKIQTLLSSESVAIWGEFNDDRIFKSLRSETALYRPEARLINFKSELISPFNPVKSLLPLLTIALKYYEDRNIFSFFLLRRLDWFSFKRNVFWEDNPPLDRYNSYYDEIIEPGTQSKHIAFRILAGEITYPMRTAVVHMCLKQEYRSYDTETFWPDTNEMAKKAEDLNRRVCVIGVSPNKIGQKICDIFSSTGSQITAIGRDIDFYSSDWQELLLKKIPNSDSPLVVILNFYDHTPGKGFKQEEIFELLWQTYKLNCNVQIVAIGSMAHYHELEGIPAEYTASKRNLRNRVVGIGRLGNYKSKLLFIEPGVVECLLKNNPPTWETYYLRTEEFAKRILMEVNANNRFTFLMANGNHYYVPEIK